MVPDEDDAVASDGTVKVPLFLKAYPRSWNQKRDGVPEALEVKGIPLDQWKQTIEACETLEQLRMDKTKVWFDSVKRTTGLLVFLIISIALVLPMLNLGINSYLLVSVICGVFIVINQWKSAVHRKQYGHNLLTLEEKWEDLLQDQRARYAPFRIEVRLLHSGEIKVLSPTPHRVAMGLVFEYQEDIRDQQQLHATDGASDVVEPSFESSV